jgi:hypothetical protein
MTVRCQVCYGRGRGRGLGLESRTSPKGYGHCDDKAVISTAEMGQKPPAARDATGYPDLALHRPHRSGCRRGLDATIERARTLARACTLSSRKRRAARGGWRQARGRSPVRRSSACPSGGRRAAGAAGSAQGTRLSHGHRPVGSIARGHPPDAGRADGHAPRRQPPRGGRPNSDLRGTGSAVGTGEYLGVCRRNMWPGQSTGRRMFHVRSSVSQEGAE